MLNWNYQILNHLLRSMIYIDSKLEVSPFENGKSISDEISAKLGIKQHEILFRKTSEHATFQFYREISVLPRWLNNGSFRPVPPQNPRFRKGKVFFGIIFCFIGPIDTRLKYNGFQYMSKVF